MQAANKFRGNFSSKTVAQQNEGNELRVITINFECSQEALDTLVKAIYARRIDLTAENVTEILKLADFLQARQLRSRTATEA